MDQLPVIFLSFANNPAQPLPNLEAEGESLYRTLTQGANQLFFQLHRESFATVEKLSHYLLEYQNRVAIFHFGGHAGQQNLLLEDVEARGEGVAALLARQQNLKLVFLNGCSTATQVAGLLSSGIPAVIATQAPVDDDRAKNMAAQFYKALAQGQTLYEAFSFASAYWQTLTGQPLHFQRSIGFSETDSNRLAWGLYASDNADLDWKLPQISHRQLIIRTVGAGEAGKTPVNDLLTNVLSEVLRPFSPSLQLLQLQATTGQRVDVRLLRRAIIDSLPAPLGEQVRKLFAADTDASNALLSRVSVDRLAQLVRTYNILMEIMGFTMLTQLWEARKKNPGLNIGADCLHELSRFLSLDTDTQRTYDYVNLIRQVRFVLDDYKIGFFVEEFNDLKNDYYEDEAATFAHRFMAEMKKILYGADGKVSAGDVEVFCLNAEEHLANLFKKMGFLARYKFTTIKGIEVIHPRHKLPAFKHKKVALDMVTAGYLDDEEDQSFFTNDNSVLLLKPANDYRDFLNLTPFIIDENALKGADQSKLFFFTGYNRERDSYFYHFAFDNNEILEISNRQYPDIKEQMDAFIELIFEKTPLQLF